MTNFADNDLLTLQHEVQRLLGRCLLRLQQYERLIKAMVAHHRLSGPIHDLERSRAAQVDATARKTLGTLCAISSDRMSLLVRSNLPKGRRSILLKEPIGSPCGCHLTYRVRISLG